MNTKNLFTKCALVSLFSYAGYASAHHAFSAEFDALKPIELKGVVKKLELVNPHSWLYLEVKKSDGTLEQWGVEFGAPFSLKQKGITKGTLTPGSEIAIKGYRAKNGQNFGYAVSATLADGRSVATGGAPDAPATQAAPQ
ncbi:hypothetical protein GCM10011613_15750 [Cellvibrio zantedeschiae]|uniref:DUF5666 domain-containing protein n=1 Tax=Cellvibrio zantedeschiae TaxID=1237077 RepID=A0ABQ3AYW1_9GAMM|nr:DUF6152 family protein [Cellvibrio zantedeschiae]GGY71733.1 hypothetical protein GCM10011613_15750 [Cellvibrio zantedeschiae]